jgi:hypothetical protein
MRQSGVVIEVSEAQIWTVIGVLAATMLSTFGLVAHFTTRLLQESIGRVLDQLDARFTALDHRFEGLDHRFEGLDHRFEAIDVKFEGLEARLTERVNALDARLGVALDALDARISVVDRDVQAVANRAFGRASVAES